MPKKGGASPYRRYKVTIPLQIHRLDRPGAADRRGINDNQWSDIQADWNNTANAYQNEQVLEQKIMQTPADEFVDVFVNYQGDDIKFVSARWIPNPFAVEMVIDTTFTPDQLHEDIAGTPFGDTVYGGMNNGWVIGTLGSRWTFAETGIRPDVIEIQLLAPAAGRRKTRKRKTKRRV